MAHPVATLRDRRHDGIKALIAFSQTGDEHPAARSWATSRWGEGYVPAALVKAAEPSSIVNDLDSGSSTGLIDRELFGAVQEAGILFRLRGTRRTGWRVRSISVGGTIAAWVQEGAAIPVNRATFDAAGLTPFKIATITVATQEMLEAAPGIETLLFNDLARAVVDQLDRDLLDPTNVGVSGVTPPSITSGVTPVPATTDAAADLAALVAAFDGDLLSSFLVMTPDIAVRLAATGDFPDLGARGGEAVGLPVLTSRNAPMEHVVLVDPTGLMVAYDEQILLEAGQEGSLQMDTEPTIDAVTPTPANLVSLWISNCTAFRAIGHVAWQVARPGSVALLQGGASDWLDIAGIS